MQLVTKSRKSPVEFYRLESVIYTSYTVFGGQDIAIARPQQEESESLTYRLEITEVDPPKIQNTCEGEKRNQIASSSGTVRVKWCDIVRAVESSINQVHNCKKSEDGQEGEDEQ